MTTKTLKNTMIYLTKVLSVDIRDRHIAVAFLGRTFRGVHLIQSAVIPKNSVPLSSMEKEEITEYEERVLDRLRSFVDEKKIGVEETVLCVPRSLVMFKLVVLPSPDEASLSNILKYELDRLIPMPASDVYFDYKVVGAAGENHFKILLAAVPKKVADYYVGLLSRVGLAPTVLDVSAFGSFNMGFFSGYDLQSPVAIIDVDAKEFEIILAENNSVCFSKSVKINTEGWPDCFFNGREFIKDDGKAVEALADNILHHFHQSLTIVKERNDGRPSEKILLSGGGQSDQILLNYLKQKSNLEVERLLPTSKAVEIGEETDGTNCLSTAIGLGLGEVKKSPLDINLLPPSLRARRKKSQIALTFIFLGLILLGFLGIIGSKVLKDRLELAKIQEELSEVKKKVLKVEEMELQYAEVTTQLSELSRLWEDDVYALDVIKEITAILPVDTWITELNIKENDVEISGLSKTASSLIPLLDASPLFKDVRFDGSVESKDGVEKFKIKMGVEK